MLSFFRKLSIGSKVRDGLLPDMGTAEEVAKIRNQGSLVYKDDTELKDSVYGTNKKILISTTPFFIL